MLTTIRSKTGYISVADYFNEAQLSSLVITDCRDAEIDFAGVDFVGGENMCHSRPMVEVTKSTNCTLMGFQHIRDYTNWTWQDWANARNGILFRSGNGNGLADCKLAGVGFGVRVLSPDAWASQLNINGQAADGLRICANHFDGEDISLDSCFWNVPEDQQHTAEHADGIHIHPFLPPEQQHTGCIKGLSLKGVRIHNHQQIAGQRWMHGLQVTDGRLLDSRLENIVIETANTNGLVIAEGHGITLENVLVKSPDPVIESQICIGTRKPNYNASTNIWTRNVVADRWGIV